MIDIAIEISNTHAEGPGNRYAIWVQGCPMRCSGCCNPEFLKFGIGKKHSVESVVSRILNENSRNKLDGISLLGGEPFSQADALADLAEEIVDAGLDVMIYSGYTMAELKNKNNESVNRLISLADIIVDGQYIKEKPDTKRRWIGSTNQSMHFLTDKYNKNDEQFYNNETVEIRLNRKEVVVNGWPWGKGLPWS